MTRGILLRINHLVMWWKDDIKIKIRCFLGYHEWYATHLLKMQGYEHHVKCARCGEEDWFDEYIFQKLVKK